jgi:uncharacterized protein
MIDEARRMTAALRRACTRGIRLAAAVALVSSFALAQAPTWEAGTDGLLPIPPLSAHVTDLTQTLAPAEKQSLEAKLVDWESRTGNQLAVLMVPTTQPEPIEAYSLRVAEKWQIGPKGKDNGVLFLVAKNDKKMRFEVGYGLEGTLTDVTARRIIAENVAPMFREGKFAAGIDAGVDRVISVVAEGKPLPPAKAAKAHRTSGGFDFGTLLLVLFIVVPIVGGILRSIFGKVLGSTVGAGIVGVGAWLVIGSLVVAGIAAVVAFFVMIFAGAGVGAAMGRRGGGVFTPTGGGWGGGGFGGGGGGGFSGGGGSFGGGGASGGWD